MGATSVTGVGPGESGGLYKPENTTGCCNAKQPETTDTDPPRTQCSTKIKTGGSTKYKIAYSNKIKAC